GAAHGGCDLAETGAALIAHGVREVRMVKKVEEISAELQAQALGMQREVLGSRKIEVHQARPIELVAAAGSYAPGGGRFGKEGRVEGRVRIAVVLYQGSGADHVGTVRRL